MTLKQTLRELASGRFEPLSISLHSLDKAVEQAEKANHPALPKLASHIKDFVETQDGIEITFADMLYMVNRILGSTKEEYAEIEQLFEKRDSGRMPGILELVELAEMSGRRTAGAFSKTSYQFHRSLQFDLKSLGRGERLIATKWASCPEEQRKGWKYLFRIEADEGSFRTWLEKQEYTRATAAEFGNLRLNYAAWDNPAMCFDYKAGALSKVKLDSRAAVDAARALAQKMTKGDYRGYLVCAPVQAWKQIQQAFRAMLAEESSAHAGTVIQSLEKCLKPGVQLKEFAAARALIANAVPLEGDYHLRLHTWKREPSADFFQGNDAGICTSLGGRQGEAMINYMVDKAIMLVDILHHGRRCGQVYLLAVTDNHGRPVLVLDSVEAGNEVAQHRTAVCESTEALIAKLAEDVGFNDVFISGNLYWRTSSKFLDMMMHRHNRRHEHKTIDWFGERVQVVDPQLSELDRLTISKIGGMNALKRAFANLTKQADTFYVGKKHYLDLFSILGQEDALDWKPSLARYTARGLLIHQGGALQ